MLDKKFEMNLVEGIQIGLRNAKIAKAENGDRFYNAEAFRKIDKVMTSLFAKIQENGEFEPIIFPRGGYKLLFAYNRKKHTLISFMNQKRLCSLINSAEIKDKQNYIFALMQLNLGDRKQQTLFDGIEWVIDENEKTKNRIKEIIKEDSEIEYITLLYDFNGYNLMKVNEVKYSQYAEVIMEKDLSDYIKIDYENIFENDNVEKEELVGELEFNLKDNILLKSNSFCIEHKNEEEEKKIDE